MPWHLLAVVVMAIGVGLRIWKAWTEHLNPNYDYGITALMAKHMAEGSDFPVFFYGQPYMGSLEPAISAFLCKIFGFSTFMVCIGTALVGAIALPLVYVWARDAGSRRAGVMAILFCLVGSDTLFHYSVAPRGGFMTMLVCGVSSIWLAARITTLLGQGQLVGVRSYLLLGLIAGLGWWSNQLIFIFLAAAIAVLLTGFRWRMVSQGLLPALAAFFAGSAPWWIWNACHGWETFDFGNSIGLVAVSDGLQAIWHMFLKIVELTDLDNWWNNVRLVLMIEAGLLFVGLLVYDKLCRRNVDTFYYREAALLVLILAIIISSTSKFVMIGASRYLLPIYPAIAVMLAVACDRLLQKWRFPWGWIVLLLLIPKHLYDLPRLPHDLVVSRPKWEVAAKLVDELGPKCDGVCVGEFAQHHWMNIASGEKLCVASLPMEKYAPYARQAELAARPAFLGNYRDIRSFLRYTGGKSSQKVLRDIAVDYDLSPPHDSWGYMHPENIVNVGYAGQKFSKEVLTDGVIDTFWSSPEESIVPSELEFTFNKPALLCGVRILCPLASYPRAVTVSIKIGESWTEVLPKTIVTGYFWSGRHVLMAGVQYFQEFRFEALSGSVDRLKLKMETGRVLDLIRLGEVLFLEKGAAPAAELPSAESCLAAVKSSGVKQFYGPRWIAGRIALEMKDDIETLVPSSIFRTANEVPKEDSSSPYPVVIREATGFLMDERDVSRSRTVLKAAGLEWKETLLGRYVLLVVVKPDKEKDVARYPLIYWTEQGCFSADIARFASRKAHELYRKALELRDSGVRSGMVEFLRKALAVYPEHQPARQALIQELKSSGQSAEASENEAVLGVQTVPKIPAKVSYKHGLELLGLTISPVETLPGSSVEISYYWKCPPAAVSERARVFVHFLGGKELKLQDDHNLLAALRQDDLKAQPFNQVFVEKRQVKIPASLIPGEYRIIIGLYDNISGKRFRPGTELKHKRSAVDLPVMLKVLPPAVTR